MTTIPDASRPGRAPAFAVRPASPIAEEDARFFRPALMTTFGFTVLLLIVTCANLAGVMQARLVNQRRDLAIRRSLGASGFRVAGEWLADAVLLALAGGVAGLAAAQLVGAWLGSIKLPLELLGDLSIDTRLDWRVTAYAAGVSVLTGVLLGVIPALRAAGDAPIALLKDEGGTMAGGRVGTRIRRALVVVQVALSVVLLIGSGLLSASLMNQRRFDPGFETGHLAILSFDLRRQGVPRDEWKSAIDRIVACVRQQPGVVQVDVASIVPLTPGRDRIGFTIPGYVRPDGKSTVSIDIANVGARYFDVLNVPFVRGGPWTADVATPAVVINETAARRYWPDADPIGKPIHIIDGADATIAGVVRDMTYHEIGETPIPFVFLPAEILPPPDFEAVVRTANDPALVLRPLAQAVTAIDRRFAPSQWMTFEEGRAATLFPMRMLSGAAVAFGAIALFLTAIGLYGVVSTMVGQRTKEIGLRMALGARTVTVLRGVLRDAFVVTVIGSVFGLIGGYWASSQLRNWLYGVGQFDVRVYVAVTAGIICLSLVAAAVPARRAAKVDPVVALRN